MTFPCIAAAPMEVRDEPLTWFTSGLKGTKESKLGVTMGQPDNLSSKG